MIHPYALYIKSCPGVLTPSDFKVGVADLTNGKLRKRLSSYQNAVGPVWEEKYTRIFIGEVEQIKKAEKHFKIQFADKIKSKEAGFSEWISDVSLEELVAFINELRNDYFIKIQSVPSEFEPCNMATCEELSVWVNETFKVDK